MEQEPQDCRLSWDQRVPISERFDDPYFSFHDGLAETRHVFLGGNDLPQRFRDGFQIAELGFGTGLNALAALDAWRGEGAFRFTSFEAYPMNAQDMETALSAWPELQRDQLVAAWSSGHRKIRIGPMHLEVIVGDALDRLSNWTGQADAWFLDGFSPAKNPEMWSAALLEQVGRHTTRDGTFATYSAAASVRSGLQAAGFQVERVRGFGHKRHMSKGRLL